jgi:3-hydroxy-9,10-secoandrosta-1,3,5(10)-triene-9,17-dione monooxygenase
MVANVRSGILSSSAPTLAELADVAEKLAPLVRANAEETERRRDPVPAVAAALRDAGLHRLYMPRRYGGHGMDWGAHYVAGERLSRECGSTGWIASLVFSHIMYVGRFPVEGPGRILRLGPRSGAGHRFRGWRRDPA